MKTSLKRLYLKYRAASPFMLVGSNAAQALQAAKTHQAWDKLEEAGLVRLIASPDESYEWDDEEERKRFGSDGAWGSIGEYRTSPDGEWISGDSVWGHVGYKDVLSPFENCYIGDIMGQTIDALKAALIGRCPHCRKAA